MKPYYHVLITRTVTYSLIHAVHKKAQKFLASLTLSTALLTAPALTHASPEELAKSQNCFSCHKVDAKRVGPSFVEVARKYAQDKDARTNIVKHIQEGCVGGRDEVDLPPQPIVATLSGFATDRKWRKTAMPPQPRVSRDEAKQLADWILSLGTR